MLCIIWFSSYCLKYIYFTFELHFCILFATSIQNSNSGKFKLNFEWHTAKEVMSLPEYRATRIITKYNYIWGG